MGDNMALMGDFELIGRVLDGQATDKERRIVLSDMMDIDFEEFFMVALRATTLFNKISK